MMLHANRLCWVSLLLAGAAGAQTITGVVNAGSRSPRGLPNYGVARGAIFVVTGSGLGPDNWQQAEFPLPVWDGLAGTSILVTVGDNTVPAPMIYSAAGEVGAIMPSNAPLGDATLTLKYNGAVATAPVTVVDAAFGIFTQSRNGQGAALAYNVSDGLDPVKNSVMQPARPGQIVALQGTGAGAVASDETQSGATDPVSTSFQVWVGNKQATVYSAGRGSWTGDNPGFPFPKGVAGWDVIQFTVPEGVSGCYVPVAVQTGSRVSNFATIAVAPVGLACSDPNGLNAADLEPLAGQPLRMGVINLTRTSLKMNVPGISMEMKSDSGRATFQRYEPAALNSPASPFKVASLGSCTVMTGQAPAAAQGTDTAATNLDAGPAIRVRGNGVTKQMQRAVDGTYSGNFGTGTSLPFPLPGAQSPFLEPGAFTADNGTGGNDVRTFTASLTLPKPLTWSNQDQTAEVDRTQGVTVTWSGGDPNGYVNIMGTSTNKDLWGTFVCTEQASAGQFTVPSVVTLSLPASTVDSAAGAQTPTGSMYVGSSVTSKFTSPDLDFGYFTSTISSMKNLTYR